MPDEPSSIVTCTRRLAVVLDKIFLRHRFFGVKQTIVHGELKRIEIQLDFSSIDEAEAFFNISDVRAQS